MKSLQDLLTAKVQEKSVKLAGEESAQDTEYRRDQSRRKFLYRLFRTLPELNSSQIREACSDREDPTGELQALCGGDLPGAVRHATEEILQMEHLLGLKSLKRTEFYRELSDLALLYGEDFFLLAVRVKHAGIWAASCSRDIMMETGVCVSLHTGSIPVNFTPWLTLLEKRNSL
jgi:hypothetical protein